MCNTEKTILSGANFPRKFVTICQIPISQRSQRKKNERHLRAKKFIHFTHFLLIFSYMDID